MLRNVVNWRIFVKIALLDFYRGTLKATLIQQFQKCQVVVFKTALNIFLILTIFCPSYRSSCATTRSRRARSRRATRSGCRCAGRTAWRSGTCSASTSGSWSRRRRSRAGTWSRAAISVCLAARTCRRTWSRQLFRTTCLGSRRARTPSWPSCGPSSSRVSFKNLISAQFSIQTTRNGPVIRQGLKNQCSQVAWQFQTSILLLAVKQKLIL